MRGLEMMPVAGERLARFVGDRVRFAVRESAGGRLAPGWRAFLRTTLGRAAVVRREIIEAVTAGRRAGLGSWRDIPMLEAGADWALELPLTEVGYFRAKPYAVDPDGWQHWPAGPDVGINVQPDACRTANTIYCAFTRMFGPTRTAVATVDPALETELKALDRQGYTVIPPSGKLRDLRRELSHIFDTLGCRILHLLPVNPAPTTYARFGRFGSPYACLDLTAIDPALVEFDRRTTGVDQFRELTHAVHARGGRLFLDIVVGHTGWGSTLQETAPDWFLRAADGVFVSPGAWGITWADLVELEHESAQLRERLAEALLEWCRRGVDGFRCDAGYKVPLPVWQYITARVRDEFPETVFLLEGLGGAWEATESLLTEGGMQWAYSELFQNFTSQHIAGYLDHALGQSARVGVLVHYAETHDNDRLAVRGRAWSLLRNRLCALASASGAYGFTCGVEWLATERINVHSSRGLAWGNPQNLVPELRRLNELLAEHPAFFDGAELRRLSPVDSPVYALLRLAAEGGDAVLVLVNTDPVRPQAVRLEQAVLAQAGLAAIPPGAPGPGVDLLGQEPPAARQPAPGEVEFTLPPGAAYCLPPAARARGLSGEAYRRFRAQVAWAFEALSHALPPECLTAIPSARLANWADTDPAGFLSAITYAASSSSAQDLEAALQAARGLFPRVLVWRVADRTRVFPMPPGHWLLVEEPAPFRASLEVEGAPHPLRAHSIPVRAGHVACFPPWPTPAHATLRLERYTTEPEQLAAAVGWLSASPLDLAEPTPATAPSGTVLLTNGRGGMARLAVDLGAIASKYDCLLAANLHPRVPVDRHVFAKRARVWVSADGFLSPLNAENLGSFAPGPPAAWQFVAQAGDGRTVAIELLAWMLPGRNTTVLQFRRPAGAPPFGRALPASCDVRLTVRVDLEDRSFHWETKRSSAAEQHLAAHCRTLPHQPGFVFTPAADRQLRVWSDAGHYHLEPEWCEGVPHPVEASRGMAGSGDAYSPGWFELPLPADAKAAIVVCAEPESQVERLTALPAPNPPAPEERGTEPEDLFSEQLRGRLRDFLARREDGVTVIAGYPWFLDWGRDTLVAVRGLVAAGLTEEAGRILTVFGRLERHGTLPNSLHGENASNRDTSDAPLWYVLACEELAQTKAEPGGAGFYAARVDETGRTLAEVLLSIATGYVRGTPNGIKMDPESGLIWSPSHFTWMDTDHPAATPREGYPVCVQALWVRCLRQLQRLDLPTVGPPWAQLAALAQRSLEERFWLEERGYLADVLLAGPTQRASDATRDTALRCNCLLPISLGLLGGPRARRTVAAATQHLLVPGAVRSLAPLPVSPPLAVHAPDGRLLNNPVEPYWGRYEGEEDTRRKPAYHNGTAWTWMLPVFCEALVRAWDFAPPAVAAARAYLASLAGLRATGCLGHFPEILDGDTPHTPRGCDAQAWALTEAVRVWQLLRTADEER